MGSTLLPMMSLLVKHSHSSPVTLPMRASLITHSVPAIMDFLIQTEAAGTFPTISVWTGDKDKVDREELDQFVDTVGRDRVYLDVPWNSGGVGGPSIHLYFLSCCVFPSISVLSLHKPQRIFLTQTHRHTDTQTQTQTQTQTVSVPSTCIL